MLGREELGEAGVDPEARSVPDANPRYGRFREPALYVTAFLRGVGVASDGYQLDEVTKAAKEFLDPVLEKPLDATWEPAAWIWRLVWSVRVWFCGSPRPRLFFHGLHGLHLSRRRGNRTTWSP